MARSRKTDKPAASGKRRIEQYDHKGQQRKNNPPVGGWARLARNLKVEIDPERIEAYRGTVSLPCEPGVHKRVDVRIVDDRGIESLRVIPMP